MQQAAARASVQGGHRTSCRATCRSPGRDARPFPLLYRDPAGHVGARHVEEPGSETSGCLGAGAAVDRTIRSMELAQHVATDQCVQTGMRLDTGERLLDQGPGAVADAARCGVQALGRGSRVPASVSCSVGALWCRGRGGRPSPPHGDSHVVRRVLHRAIAGRPRQPRGEGSYGAGPLRRSTPASAAQGAQHVRGHGAQDLPHH
mmetsp:Transcript_15247/g.41991  ORF Transcript_15247/g.41991 Transcript_15247/m.41991 type:complete len:204 (+) Transcript_15247:3119-3730(+)